MKGLLVLVALAVPAVALLPNMNGAYVLSDTPKAPNSSKFSTDYGTYPGVGYFDVYSPTIKTLYSQVFWTMLPPVDLPADIVQKFDGKGMAIVGFEMDQVIRTPQGDVSIGYSRAYNHHHETTVTGKHSVMKKVKLSELKANMSMPYYGHQRPEEDAAWIVESLKPDSAIPTSADLGAGNGGEARKSWHGFAPPYALIIDSPTQLHVTPMQIDTWNRDKMNLTGTGGFVPGPLPRTSLAPTTGDIQYSGLLECPLTTRVQKVVDADYTAQVTGQCGGANAPVQSSQECVAAVGQLLPGLNTTHSSGANPSLPAGCLVMAGATPGEGRVFYNTLNSSTVPCGMGASAMSGETKSLVDVRVTVTADLVNITLTGPDGNWFGVGFGAQAMKDAPWAIIVDGKGAVTERKLADQSPGEVLTPSVKVLASSAAGGMRTVSLTRAPQGPTASYYTFNMTQTSINFINALGRTPTISYHKARTAAVLNMLPANGSAACVCAHQPAPFGQGQGSLRYQDGTTVGFNNKCAPQPRSDLLAQHNPTCDVRTYVGGQIACHHMWSLLDADQDIPWQDQPLEYNMKFRIWYQEYQPNFHKQATRTTWGIASPVEYDVPQCPAGTPPEECIHTITGTFDVGGSANMKLVAAHFHCHAPTCLSVAMYNNATGELLCEQKPIYGGTGQIDEKKFDEPGYILQPPCVWGREEDGLEAPVVVGGQTLHIIKHSNSTYGHHGEMAWLQVFYVDE